MILAAFASKRAVAQTTGGPITASESQEAISGPVVEVRFVGNHELSSAELGTIVSTKVTGWFTRNILHPIGLGDGYQTLELSTLQHDTAVLNQYYKDQGFILANSTYRVTPDRSDLKAYYDYIRHERLIKGPGKKSDREVPEVRDTVTFIIDEGPEFKIARISTSGLDALPEQFQTELTERGTIKSGQRWSRAAAAKEVQRLADILVENGYPNAKHDSIVIEHVEGHTNVNVLLYFSPGHRYKYGPIRIEFDTATAEKSIVREDVILAQLMIDTGQWYQLSKVQRSEQNLYKLNTFDLVRVSLDTGFINAIPDSLRDSASVPVVVFLRMKLRGELPVSVFAGTGSQGFVAGGSVGYINRNLLQEADNFSVQAALQPLPTTQNRYSGNVNYIRPYIGLGRIPLITGLGYSNQHQAPVKDIKRYDISSYSANVGSSIILSAEDNKTTLTPNLLVEKILSDGDSSLTLPPHQVNLLPSVGYQDDRRNDPVNPTGGDLLSASAELGVKADWLFGMQSSQYFKLAPQLIEYFDMTNNGSGVIATRLRVGASWLFDSSDLTTHPSLDHRFFAGGSSSNRGWSEQSLVVSADPNRPGNAGGYNEFEFNLEFRYAPFQYTTEFTSWQKFSSPLRLVLFYDAGNTWDNILWSNPAAMSWKMVAQTLGFGIRYNLFFGALRADIGFKLYDPSGHFDDDNTHAITPGMEGAWLWDRNVATPIFTVNRIFNLHFGIGQAF